MKKQFYVFVKPAFQSTRGKKKKSSDVSDAVKS